jgi:hypothetical protein
VICCSRLVQLPSTLSCADDEDGKHSDEDEQNKVFHDVPSLCAMSTMRYEPTNNSRADLAQLQSERSTYRLRPLALYV